MLRYISVILFGLSSFPLNALEDDFSKMASTFCSDKRIDFDAISDESRGHGSMYKNAFFHDGKYYSKKSGELISYSVFNEIRNYTEYDDYVECVDDEFFMCEDDYRTVRFLTDFYIVINGRFTCTISYYGNSRPRSAFINMKSTSGDILTDYSSAIPSGRGNADPGIKGVAYSWDEDGELTGRTYYNEGASNNNSFLEHKEERKKEIADKARKQAEYMAADKASLDAFIQSGDDQSLQFPKYCSTSPLTELRQRQTPSFKTLDLSQKHYEDDGTTLMNNMLLTEGDSITENSVKKLFVVKQGKPVCYMEWHEGVNAQYKMVIYLLDKDAAFTIVNGEVKVGPYDNMLLYQWHKNNLLQAKVRNQNYHRNIAVWDKNGKLLESR